MPTQIFPLDRNTSDATALLVAINRKPINHFAQFITPARPTRMLHLLLSAAPAADNEDINRVGHFATNPVRCGGLIVIMYCWLRRLSRARAVPPP